MKNKIDKKCITADIISYSARGCQGGISAALHNVRVARANIAKLLQAFDDNLLISFDLDLLAVESLLKCDLHHLQKVGVVYGL